VEKAQAQEVAAANEGFPVALVRQADASTRVPDIGSTVSVVTGETYAAIEVSRLEADERAAALLEEERQEEERQEKRRRIARERAKTADSTSTPKPPKSVEKEAKTAVVNPEEDKGAANLEGEAENASESKPKPKKTFERPKFWRVE
jgi:hypothetical protein